jgi:predicted enzyme related to lactoylglutathione lyase
MSKGRNVWFDLLTTDLEGAKRYYSEVIGWKTEQWADADPKMPYTMWKAGDAMIGGVMPLPDEAKQMGAPTHWIAYTTVDDVDATTAECSKTGGKVYKAPFDIPKVGRVAVLADPQGAVFAVFKPAGGEMPAAPAEQPGHFSWAELNTIDYEGAWKFYSHLFGWVERSKMDMGPMGIYFMFNDPTVHTKGGMSNMAKQMNMPAHWLHYVTVSDIEATCARVKQHGGRVLNGPMPIPGDDFIAQCMDPQGGAFAVYASGKKK